MANWHTLIDKFTQGELSPLLYGQVREEILRDGCQLILNGFVTPLGPVITRAGTSHLLTYDQLTVNQMRVWRFIGPPSLNNKDLFAVFYDGTVAIVDWKTGVIGGSTGPYFQMLRNTDFFFNTDGWGLQSNSVTNGTYGETVQGEVRGGFQIAYMGIEIDGAANVPAGYRTPLQVIGQLNAIEVEAQEYIVETDVFFSWNTYDNLPDLSDDWRYVIRVEVLNLGVEIFSEEFELEANVQVPPYVAKFTAPTSLPVGSLINHRVEFFAEALNDNALLPRGVTYYVDVNQVLGYIRPLVPDGPLELATPYTGEELNDLHFVQSPYNNQELLVLHPNHPPQALEYDRIADEWKFEDYAIVNAPATWGADGDWPNIGAGIQGRLALTGLNANPEIIWMSKSGDWKDFDQGTALPDESIEFTAQVRDVNTWILGGKAPLYGDRLKEHQLTFNQFLAPNDIGVSVQTSFGSERMPQKITIGKSIVLATGGNNDLRLCFYNDDDGGFVAPNIILKAEHLGKKQFKRHFYTRDPNQTLWNVMGDGSILLCSFDDEFSVQAWSRFETDGMIIDGCSINDEFGRDVVILVISRVIDNKTVVNIETISDLTDFRNWKTLDSTVTTFPEDRDELVQDGFEVLEKKTVAVFEDNQYAGTQQVVNGTVTMSEPASRLDVGLIYPFAVQTFPTPSLTSNAGLTSKKRYSKVGVRGLFSVPPIINGQRPPDRSPQSTMNNSEPKAVVLDSDVVDMNTNEQGNILIEETLPMRLVIAAIYGKLTSEEL